jgi:outer membrane protein OmpA-like peptidoglycan-associated protein
VFLDGYASTKGRRRENFSLGYDRAVEVMKILKQLSGNRADEKLFKTASHGEYDSPVATDVKTEEKELGDYRAVVIRITESRKFKF